MTFLRSGAFASTSSTIRSLISLTTYQVAVGLHFLRGAMDRQLFKTTQAAQEIAAAGLVLRQRIARFGLSYGIIEFFTYYRQTYLLKRGIFSPC